MFVVAMSAEMTRTRLACIVFLHMRLVNLFACVSIFRQLQFHVVKDRVIAQCDCTQVVRQNVTVQYHFAKSIGISAYRIFTALGQSCTALIPILLATVARAEAPVTACTVAVKGAESVATNKNGGVVVGTLV